MGSIGNSNITKEFMESVLKKSVKAVNVKVGSNPGDNFTSILFSIHVTFNYPEEKDVHLLLKTYPSHPTRRKFLEETNLFLKELLVYKTLIPEYLQLQKEIGNSVILKPAVPFFVGGRAVNYDKDCIQEPGKVEEPFFHEDFQNYLIMLDVRKSLGFRMADKLKGLDYDHCKLVIIEIAKLHTLSLAYKVHHGLKNLKERFPFLTETLFVGNIVEPMMKGGFATVGAMLEECLGSECEALKSMKKLGEKAMEVFKVFLNSEGVDEKAARKFMRVQPSETEKLLELEDPWVVGGHGDCWINNMLFKYDEQSKKPLEAILVDLQICRESCLTVDLVYFIYNSTDHKLRKAHLNDLLSLYYESVIKFCEILKTEPFPGFTLENLKARFHRSKVLGFVFSVMILPIILQNPENAIDMDSIEHSGDDKEGGQDFAEMIQAMPKNKDDEQLLKTRFIGMINEFSEDGVL